jgi:sulfur dioxygenase
VTSAIAAASTAAADVKLSPGDIIQAGSLRLTCLATPGHTNGCMCFYLPPSEVRTGLVFTGESRASERVTHWGLAGICV